MRSLLKYTDSQGGAKTLFVPTNKRHGVKFLGVEGVSPSDFEDRL